MDLKLMTERKANFIWALVLAGLLLAGCKSSGSDGISSAPPPGGGTNPPTSTNVAPAVSTPGQQSSEIGISTSLAIDATDADGDPLTYSATGSDYRVLNESGFSSCRASSL